MESGGISPFGVSPFKKVQKEAQQRRKGEEGFFVSANLLKERGIPDREESQVGKGGFSSS